MSLEVLGGGASVGTDRSGGNNVGDECRIGIDQNEESSDHRFVEASGGGVSVGTSDRSGGNNVGDQIEQSSDQRFNKQEKIWFDRFEKASEVVNKTSPPANAKPMIQRRGVPYMLSWNDKLRKYFHHKKLSFGREDYSVLALKIEKNQIKINLAAEFLQQNGVKKEDLYEDIKKQIEEFKDCYNKFGFSHYYEDKYSLTRMLLVDGCAILQFMYISVGFGEIGIHNL